LRGRTVEKIRIVGNTTVPTSSIANLIHTREGDKYDPETVEEDYQRVYRELRKFSNVTARAEPTADGGVVVVFVVEEQTHLCHIPAGRYDPEQSEQDMAGLRRVYEGKGFFDVRVGRKLVWSPDQTELQVEFLVEEGPRYTINHVVFQGNTRVGDADLRKELK